MTESPALHLFAGFGVELEYMIVDVNTLDVSPITDRLLYQVAGEYLSEIEMGRIAWSNELALHVVELKTNGPAPDLVGLDAEFQTQVRHINELLGPMEARLMPTAMHPWMNPDREMKLWPHEYNPIYEAYNRIFDCRGHGWANLQSVHLNLPFCDDEEFARLHAAIRLLLPILPAIAASSPIVERQLTGIADNRMEVYRQNSRLVPSIAAEVIPEAVFTQADYESQVFQRMYHDIAPLDPEGTLQHEWLNARGAIARFDRNTIEIRILDVQECPAVDVAICEAVANVLHAMTDERWTSVDEQKTFGVDPLAKLLVATVRDAERTTIGDAAYLAQFGISAGTVTAHALWKHLLAQCPNLSAGARDHLNTVLREGPLSRRIERALAGNMSQLRSVYGRLCDCLADGQIFT